MANSDSWAWDICPVVMWVRLDYIQFSLHLVHDVLSHFRYHASHVAIKKTVLTLMDHQISLFFLMLLQICWHDDGMRHTLTSQWGFQYSNHRTTTSAAYCSNLGRLSGLSVLSAPTIQPLETSAREKKWLSLANLFDGVVLTVVAASWIVVCIEKTYRASPLSWNLKAFSSLFCQE